MPCIIIISLSICLNQVFILRVIHDNKYSLLSNNHATQWRGNPIMNIVYSFPFLLLKHSTVLSHQMFNSRKILNKKKVFYEPS